MSGILFFDDEPNVISELNRHKPGKVMVEKVESCTDLSGEYQWGLTSTTSQRKDRQILLQLSRRAICCSVKRFFIVESLYPNE